MSNEIPIGWERATLGALADLGGGTTPSKLNSEYWENGTIPWATPSDITSLANSVNRIERTQLMITKRALRECSLQLYQPGTVFMTSRASIGFVAINDVPMATNQGFITFSCNDNADPAFLSQWLLANRDLMISAAGGSTFKELSRGTAKLLPILVPPLGQQRRIAEVLCSLDEYIVACERVALQARTVQAATFETFLKAGARLRGGHPIQNWHTGKIAEIDTLPPDWKIVRLIDVAKLESGHTPSRRVPEFWTGGEIGWLSLHDTQNLESPVITRTELSITQAGLDNSSARLLPEGTVCFSRTATVGKCVIMGHSMATSQDFANFICSEQIANRYLLYLLRWMQPIWKQLSSGSTHKTIYMPTFESLQIILPPRSAQDAIVAAMDALTTAIDENAKLADAARRLKISLAIDLFSGARTVVPGHEEAVMRQGKPVQAAFKRAVLAAEVVHQLHKDAKFGSVKHEKIVHLCEYHADLHRDIDRHAYKKAAGPYDPKARRSVEANFKSHKWFDVKKAQGGRTEYVPMAKCGGHKEYFDRYFAAQRDAIQAIIDLLRPLDSQRCEIIATLYAVWNDYLLDNVSPTDSQIVSDARNNWHSSKQTIPEDRWAKALTWMREKRLVPQGTGEKTRIATA